MFLKATEPRRQPRKMLSFQIYSQQSVRSGIGRHSPDGTAVAEYPRRRGEAGTKVRLRRDSRRALHHILAGPRSTRHSHQKVRWLHAAESYNPFVESSARRAATPARSPTGTISRLRHTIPAESIMNPSYVLPSPRASRISIATPDDRTRFDQRQERVPVYPILHLKPPYTPSTTTVMVREVDVAKIVPGSVLALHISSRNVDWMAFSATVRKLRARVPAVPVVLSLGPDITDGLYLAGQATRVAVRAVVAGSVPLGESLRRPLTSTDGLGPDVVEWLGLFGIRLSPMIAHLVSEIFTEAPRFTEVGALLKSMGAADSSTRFRFRKKGLPAPSRWLQAARALHAALLIQMEPDKSILSHACNLGYADHSALCHQMKRVFGTTPAAVRETLGWEWLLERWVRKEILLGRPAR